MDTPGDAPKKRKPVKLEWQGGLLDSGAGTASGEVERVRIKGAGGEPSGGGKDVARAEERPWKGTARARREAKGRGGKPVALLHGFAPEADAGQLQWLCRALKEKLACGGTVEGAEVLVQVDDFARVQAAASSLGVTVVRGGGFG